MRQDNDSKFNCGTFRLFCNKAGRLLCFVDKAMSLLSFQMPPSDNNAARRHRIKQFCRNPETRSLYRSLTPREVTVYNNSVAYCRNFKCASTLGMVALKQLFSCSDDNPCAPQAIADKHNLSKMEVIRHLNDKYSFFFVREPYRRLFSTYSNKFYLPKGHWAPVGPYIAKHYRTNPSEDSLEFGHDVTFKELIQYTVDQYERGIILDPHLRPMHELCNPCRFNYTYVGRVESVNSDWDQILNDLKRAGILNTSVATERKALQTLYLSEIGHIYKTLAITKGSSISRYQFFQRSWSYFQINGRISKQIQLPYAENEVDRLNKSQFHKEVDKAIKFSQTFGKDVANQKTEALLQAYSTIPMDLLERLRKVVLVDCLMFGYDDRPAWLFNRTETQDLTSYKYFVGI